MFRSRKDLMSRREERELLKLGGRVLADNFPNPERAGCPRAEVLRAMAFRHKQAPPAADPSDHLTVCSPCFREYSRYRQQARQQTYIRSVLLAAALVIIAISATLLWRHGGPLRQQRPEIAQLPSVPAMVDLRHLSPARGERPPQETAGIAIPTGRLQLTIQLPVGSEDGQYKVAVFKRSGEQISAATGTAVLAQNVMTLKVTLDLSGVPPGQYAFGTRREGSEWSWYQAEIR